MFARLLTLLLLVSLCALTGLTADAGETTVLVIPARYTVVQLAFDIAYLRSATVLAYDTATGGERLLHRWDASLGDWTAIDMETYRSDAARGRAWILAATVDDMPADLLEGAGAWSDEVGTIPSLRSLNVINTLDKHMDFSTREWKWLAGRHGLKLEDRNAERRRYGRYGKPGTTSTAPIIEDEIPAETALEPVEPETPTGEAAAPDPSGTADVAPEDK